MRINPDQYTSQPSWMDDWESKDLRGLGVPESQFMLNGADNDSDLAALMSNYKQISHQGVYRPGEIEALLAKYGKGRVEGVMGKLRGSRDLKTRNVITALQRRAGRRLGTRSGASATAGLNAMSGSFAELLQQEAGMRENLAKERDSLLAGLTAENVRSRAGVGLAGRENIAAQQFKQEQFQRMMAEQRWEFYKKLKAGAFSGGDDGGGSNFVSDLFSGATTAWGLFGGGGDDGGNSSEENFDRNSVEYVPE